MTSTRSIGLLAVVCLSFAVASTLPSAAAAPSPAAPVRSAAATLSAQTSANPRSIPAAAPGWRLTFSDNFNGTALNSAAWGTYQGGERRSSNVSVHDGMLTIQTRKQGSAWTSGGVSNRANYAQKYGRFEARMRFAPGAGVRAVGLLWPSAKVWPPEIDFFEIGSTDPQRTANHMTNAYKPGPGEPSAAQRPGIGMQHSSYTGDFTQWHVIGVEWSPTAIKYTMDGVVRVTVTGSHIPSQAMRVCFQTHTGLSASARPNAQTPASVPFDIDWVAVYSR